MFCRRKKWCKSIDKGTVNLEDSILTIWNQVFSGIKYHIRKISHECKAFDECKGFPDCEEFSKFNVDYDDDFDKIKFVSNDLLPLGNIKEIFFILKYILMMQFINYKDDF